MVGPRTTVDDNPIPVGTDNDAVEHVVESRTAAGIRFGLGKQGPDPCAAALRHSLHDSRKSFVFGVRGEIPDEVNRPVWSDGHALCAIRNAVVNGAIKPRACRGAVSGLERDTKDSAIEFGVIEIIIPRIFGDADGG